MKFGIIKGIYNINKYIYFVKYKLMVNYRFYYIEYY